MYGERSGKYNAKKTEYKGELYDSKKEANYAKHLDSLKASNKIKDWDRQIRLYALINGVKTFYLRLDFVVYGMDGYAFRFIDVKGYKAGPAYSYFRLKKKILEALYDIEIEEV